MDVTEQLRRTIEASGQTHYRIAKESGVDSRTLDRFIDGTQQEIRSGTIDKLCRYFKLELRPISSPRKQAGKKTATSRKQSRKK